MPGLLGALFDEQGRGDRQAREALFLTFNVDLGFFETRLLGPVRGAGAAVTVVADGSVFDPDARSVRAAGHGYALGLAAMNGAFHPKLTVLAGPQRAVIGIGSGNVTVSGWHANDEVLTTVLASRDDGVPTLVGDVAAFLHRLPDVVTMSALAREGVVRTADQLASLHAVGPIVETGHRLLHTLDRPILEQLPDEPADALELTAPFHDLTGRALDALIDRFRPSAVRVLVQPGQTVMDPAVLQRAADKHRVALHFLQPAHDRPDLDPYRHGKVITALVNNEPSWSLVGSANLSAAALLGIAPSANCETAVLAATHRSLLPTLTAPVTDTLALRHTIDGGAEAHLPDALAVVRLLEARSFEAGVEISLSAPAPADLLVEYSLFEWPPERFAPLGTLPAGQSTAVFGLLLGPQTRVRVQEQIQFLAFPEAVTARLRPVSGEYANRNASPADLFASDTIAAQWSGALTRLLLSHGRARTAGVAGSPSVDGDYEVMHDWRTLDDPDAWAEYSEGALSRLGLPIFQLASGSPVGQVVGAALPNAAPAWEDRFDDTDEAYEEDQSAETVDADEETSPAASTELSAARRGRLRKWISDVAELSKALPPLECIAIVQLVTAGTSALIWNSAAGPDGWFTPLEKALDGLTREHWPAAAAAQASAIAAVGLYRLRMAVPDDERGPRARTFNRLAKELRPLVDSATPEAVVTTLPLLEGATLHPRSPQDLLHELANSLQSSPTAAIQRVLEHVLSEYEATWLTDQHLLVEGPGSNPLAVASTVLMHTEAVDAIAVTVNTAKGRRAMVVRVPDRLTVVETINGQRTYKTYRTTGLLAAAGVLSNTELALARRLSKPPFTVAGEVDLAVLEAVGLGDPGLT